MKTEDRKQQASILTVKAVLGDIQVQKMETEHFLVYTNQVLAQLIPAAEKHGGSIDDWNGAGLVAFYEKEPENALHTVLEICKDSQSAYAAGISCGPVLRGTVGYGKCKWEVTLSEDKKISDRLQSLASSYAVTILVTAAYAEQVRDFTKRYTHRLLGDIYMEDTGKNERVYEVFEGEAEERIFLKKKTKMVFEEGIHLFHEGKSERARKHFIEVLKIDREDKVAREYLRRTEV